MEVRVLSDPEKVAREAAVVIAGQARAAVAARGRFVFAISGGSTPWVMLRALTMEDAPWERMHVFQVDERVAPLLHPDRNLTQASRILIQDAPGLAVHLYPMPVEMSDLAAGARLYEETLGQIAGWPPVLDLVHLGLGTDGHTASLVPGDPVLGVTDKDVSTTRIYQGRRRMTLTYPMLNRSRRILWLITGTDKAGILAHLWEGDLSIPAGRVSRDQALILADRAAAGEIQDSYHSA
jgi:6-phosphogluconolactonase